MTQLFTYPYDGTVGNNVDDETEWVSWNRSGAGHQRFDNHTDHAPDVVADMQNASAQDLIFQTACDTDDQFAEVNAFIDTNGGSDNEIGVILRCNESAISSTWDGYAFVLTQDSGDNTTRARIQEVTNGSRTNVLSSADLDNTELDRQSVIRLRGECNGTSLKLYLNGDLVVDTTDSTHTTGKNIGVVSDRSTSAGDSQPFSDLWAGGDLTGQTSHEWDGSIEQYQTGMSNSSSSVSATYASTPTSGRLLVAIYGCMDDTSDTDQVMTAPTGWTEQIHVEAGSGQYSSLGLATKDSAGTEGTVTANFAGTVDGAFIVIFEMAEDWEYDDAAGSIITSSGTGQVTTSALTAGDHLAFIAAANADGNGGNMASPDEIRSLVGRYKGDHGGVPFNVMVGCDDIGTGTSAWTADLEADFWDAADDDYPLIGLVLYKSGAAPAANSVFVGLELGIA